AGREALARLLLAGARAVRGVPRAPAARRPVRLSHLPPRARPRAALRVHTARLSVRVPLVRRQLGDRVVRDAVRPLAARSGMAAATRSSARPTWGRSSARPA